MVNKITPKPITDRYTNEDLKQYGIYLEYIVNPKTFKPAIFVFVHDRKIKQLEFKRTDSAGIIDQYINDFVDKIIIKQRNEKINRIINKLWK